MTFIVDGTNGLTFNNSTTQASAGQVLQVVQGSTTTSTTTTSTSPVTSTLTASITPKFSTSKIFVLINFGQAGTNGSAAGLLFYMYRNGSSIAQLAQNTLYNNGTFTLNLGPASFQYLDSPATTSSTTYAVFFASPNGTSVVTQRDSIVSYITLMEIAA
jgi:hypothetical protein